LLSNCGSALRGRHSIWLRFPLSGERDPHSSVSKPREKNREAELSKAQHQTPCSLFTATRGGKQSERRDYIFLRGVEGGEKVVGRDRSGNCLTWETLPRVKRVGKNKRGK